MKITLGEATICAFVALVVFAVTACDSAQPRKSNSQVTTEEKPLKSYDGFSAILDYLATHQLGRVLSVQYDDDLGSYEVSTYTTDNVGFLSGGGYKLTLKVTGDAGNFKVIEVRRVNWVS